MELLAPAAVPPTTRLLSVPAAGAMGGMLFPVVTGIFLDHFKAAGNVTAGYGVLFAFCAGAYLVSLALLQLLNPKLEPMTMSRR